MQIYRENSTNKDKDDIVVIDAIDNGLINYRTSWREKIINLTLISFFKNLFYNQNFNS